MTDTLFGECLCGAVTFSVKHQFSNFYQCHCQQCQKLTGSAFASNILTSTDNIKWLSGHELVTHYQHPTRDFSKSFCQQCGSGLPFINKSKTSLIIPAGSLNHPPELHPKANIFISDEAGWLQAGLQAKRFDGFPD